MDSLTLGSLFDGSGGFPLAGILSGITPIWASEIEPFAIRMTTKRLPSMRHLGDIRLINGGEIEPVDIITFGSPCQDLSAAGRRHGLTGSRSVLFFEAIRIIKEMRKATKNEHPRFIVWENVPGAFSSHHGADFMAVLDAICSIKEETLSIPRPQGRWRKAGYIVADGFSLAWRLLDAQYWGVPQRRRRIFLVADFAGEGAKKIFFEPENVREYTEESRLPRKAAAGAAEAGAGETGRVICLNDQGGRYNISVLEDLAGTMLHHPLLLFENNRRESNHALLLDSAPTVTAKYGAGGNNTLFALQGSMIGRRDKNGPRGNGVNENICFTLNTVDRHVVAYGIERAAFTQGKNATIDKDCQPRVATSPGEDNIRRLTPMECARLQGFPDGWREHLETENPSEEEIDWWSDVFDTYSHAIGIKPKSRRQVIRWLKNPYSDSAEYKLWGNGVALPCVRFILSALTREEKKES